MYSKSGIQMDDSSTLFQNTGDTARPTPKKKTNVGSMCILHIGSMNESRE